MKTPLKVYAGSHLTVGACCNCSHFSVCRILHELRSSQLMELFSPDNLLSFECPYSEMEDDEDDSESKGA